MMRMNVQDAATQSIQFLFHPSLTATLEYPFPGGTFSRLAENSEKRTFFLNQGLTNQFLEGS
ncbi:MAG: hypothetical protein B0D92_06970 [Spirochaeta sp. LUC14_002_19_P3]|nr:MAG: hypothetical protein B0D92_06970 [Spirochaeta sp. LUC14_002_19_P3]